MCPKVITRLLEYRSLLSFLRTLVGMTVQFLCQLDGTKGAQITGKTLFLSVSVRVFPEQHSSKRAGLGRDRLGVRGDIYTLLYAEHKQEGPVLSWWTSG